MDKQTYSSFLKESIQNLKKFYNNEQVVLFLGAGIARDSKLPLWNELIDSLASELNIKEINNSFDFFVKLAQQYFIQFGENIYYKKLLDLFDLDTKKSNNLIDNLVDLNCKYVVTTNWDDLIEKSITNQGLFYDFVKKDDDFSKLGINTNIFIKIHGDLIDRNIVFKEEDYLNYENNHPLITNFLKSLFVRNVFLVVGYSLSDFNIKQLISWVQSKRSKNLPIYFIEVGKDFDYLEFEYYKRKNIYILYLKHLFEEEKNYSNRIISFINLFKSDNINFNDEEEFIFSLCEALKPFDNFEYISAFELVNFIRKKFDLYKINEIFYLSWGNPYIYIQNDEIVSIIKKINLLKIARLSKTDNYYKKLFNCIKFIYKIFRKSLIFGIDFIDKFPLVRFSTKIYIDDDFIELNTKDINNKLMYENNLLKKAFYFYKLEKYYEAYLILDEYSLKEFKERNFFNYFIAEFNKKQLAHILKMISYKMDKKQKEIVKKIYYKNKKVSLFDLYLQLPKAYRGSIKFLLELDKFIDDKFKYAFNKKEDTQKKGENRLDHFAVELDYFLNDLLFFVLNNSLMIDNFLSKTFQNIFEAMLYEYKYKKVKFIKHNFIYIATIGYSNWKEINRIFKEINTKIKLSANDKLSDIYFKTYNNLFDEYIKQNSLDSKYPTYFKNYFMLLCNSNLINEDIDYITNSIVTIFKDKKLMLDDYEMIDIFISRYSNNIDEKILKNILETFLDKFLCGNINFNDTQSIGRSISFGSIFEVLKEKNINVDYTRVERFIEIINNWDIDTKFYIYSYFLTGLYFIIDEDKKPILKEKLLELFNVLKNAKQKIESNIYKNIKLEFDKKYLYFEYMLILKFYGIYESKQHDIEKLKDYIEKYDGFCSCFYEIFKYIQLIQQKIDESDFLKEIENLLKEKIDYHNHSMKKLRGF